MFGNNLPHKQFARDDGSLLVHSIWYTLQGEGPDAGRPAIFLRLARCNLRCYFCDTDFEYGTRHDMRQLERIVIGMAKESNVKLLVITGGEPFLQNFLPLTELCNEFGIAVCIETAGTLCLPRAEKYFARDRSIRGNLIVCSPKTRTINSDLIPLIGAYKYIVQEKDLAYDNPTGLPVMSTQIKGKRDEVFRPPVDCDWKQIYVQPMDIPSDPEQTKINMRAAAMICLATGWRLSIQLHKLVGLD